MSANILFPREFKAENVVLSSLQKMKDSASVTKVYDAGPSIKTDMLREGVFPALSGR